MLRGLARLVEAEPRVAASRSLQAIGWTGMVVGAGAYAFGTALALTLIDLDDAAFRSAGMGLFVEALVLLALAAGVTREKRLCFWVALLWFPLATAGLTTDPFQVGPELTWSVVGLRLLLVLPLLCAAWLLWRAPAPQETAEPDSPQEPPEPVQAEVLLEVDGAALAEVARRARERRPKGDLIYVIRRTGERPVELREGQTLKIGCHEDNDIVLNVGGVSRFHAVFEWETGQEPALRDTGSSNGIEVDGRHTERAVLRDKMAVRIGDQRLVVREYEEEPA